MVFQRLSANKNGLLSYENPNYHLDPSRLDDALNSNTDQLYEELYQELDDICNMGTGMKTSLSTGPGRKGYASLDIGSMGVDISTGPVTNIDTSNYTDNRRDGESNGNDTTGPMDTNTNSSRPRYNICEKTTKNNIDNREEDIGIPHIVGHLNNDLYAIPVKRRNPKSPEEIESSSPDKERSDETDLPPGWEKHEDNDGPYYWHIKSGTIQREVPIIPGNDKVDTKNNFNKDTDNIISKFENSVITSVTRSSTSSALDLESDDRKRKEELAFKRRSYPARPEPESKERPIRFAVRSLGWVEIAEDDLTPERSSKAVNKCIVDLSLGRNDLLDVVGRWGDGKDLFMDLDEGALKLIDPENLTVLNTQPIHTIRVWGVGRDNGRDFAYVARDRSTRKHMCHVFRCDMPARTIANTLRDICKKIMIERSLQQNLAKPIDINCRGLATRPTNLPTEHRRSNRNGHTLITQSFPTPMEEPKKVLRAQYLGSTQVTQATGMDILNEAIDTMVSTVPQEEWQSVNVAVAPSMISIQQPNDDKLIAECRVRYLSFLGIGKNVKQCAFIMHTAQDIFMAHIFHCEPSSGALCKTVEAACKIKVPKSMAKKRKKLGLSWTQDQLTAAINAVQGDGRLVHRFETKNCICKGKSTGRPTVLTENVIENIQERINRSPKKAVLLSQQTGLSMTAQQASSTSSMLLFLACLCLISRSFGQIVITRFDDYDSYIDKIHEDDDPDNDLTTPQIIRRHGYYSESHVVETADGYLLTIHRIPRNKNGNVGKQPVFIQHGLLSSSADFVINGDNKSLPFILSDLGYDVWLGNSRGNTYSRAHAWLSTSSQQYWNFTFHEMGVYDLPCALTYISRLKNKSGDIIYIGHSMGTTMFFVMASLFPEFTRSNVKMMVALAPVAYMTHATSPIRYFAPFVDDIEWLAKYLGIKEFLPHGLAIQFLSYNCKKLKIEKIICQQVIFLVCGFDKYQLDKKLLLSVLSHDPSGSSTKTIIHYAQEIKHNGDFMQYDYGKAENMIHYGNSTPPVYSTQNITVPIYFMYGQNDWLADEIDVLRLAGEVKNNLGTYKVPFKYFNHIDFIWARDVYDLVYENLIAIIKQYG
ncbi:hypothetical protein FQA39_LY08561 [Lamprigera yunnana]|nr:hypothetical protein FQA39_LY08561 [Lamprigera yunnana]